MEFTLDTTLGTLMDTPQAKTVLVRYAPALATNPMVGMIKGLSLKAILAMPQAAQYGLTQEKVEKVLAEINKLV